MTKKPGRVERMFTDPCCKHFNGMINTHCGAGIAYAEVGIDHAPMKGRLRSLPCMPEDNHAGAKCASYVEATPEEIEADRIVVQRALDLMDRGISPCCEAPLDESKVIRGGQYDGHGNRTCSKCGAFVFGV